MSTKKQKIQIKVFSLTAGRYGRDLTVDEVKEAIIIDSNLALCKMINKDEVITWCLTEVDVFFPDDDYVPVTKEVAEQIIAQKDDVYHQVLEGIDIYRRV